MYKIILNKLDGGKILLDYATDADHANLKCEMYENELSSVEHIVFLGVRIEASDVDSIIFEKVEYKC